MERREIYDYILSHNMSQLTERQMDKLKKSCQEAISTYFTPSRQLTSGLAFAS